MSCETSAHKSRTCRLMLVTGSSLVEERVRGLDAGADDYVGKPFVFAELAARIRAVLRRGNRPANAVLSVADLAGGRGNHTGPGGGNKIGLGPKKFCLLEGVMWHRG